MPSSLKSTEHYSPHHQSATFHTIAFVEDVLGRLAQVSVAGRHGHCYWKTKAKH